MSQQIASAARHFLKSNYQVKVLVPQQVEAVYRREFSNLEILRLPNFPAARRFIDLLSVRRAFKRVLCSENKSDVVYWIGGLRGLLVASTLPCEPLRVFTWASGIPDSRVRQIFAGWLGSRLDLITTLAPTDLTDWKTWSYLPLLCRNNPLISVSPRDGSLRVGWFSRLDFPKRPDVWVEILRQAQAQSPEIEGVLIGNGMYKKDIAAQAGKVLRHCALWGEMSPLDAFNAMDVLVFWSDSEGVPNVIQEAIWCGVPVVTNQLPGIKALLPDSNMGVVKSANEAAALILQLNSDEKKRQSLLTRQQARMREIAREPRFEARLEAWLTSRA